MKFVNVELKLNKMRKPQSFTIYPCLPDDKKITIQSDKSIATVNLETKIIFLSKSRQGGSYFIDLSEFRGAQYFELNDLNFEKIKKAFEEMAGVTQKSGLGPNDRTVDLFG